MKPTLLRIALLLLAAAPASAQLISGTVVDSNGNPVQGVNINAYDSTGDEVHLANDGTDALGQFLTLFEDGLDVHTVEFIPPLPPTTSLLVKHVPNVAVVAGTTNMGTIALAPGVGVIGRVVRTGGVPVSGIKLQAVDGLSGELVPLAQVKTNLTGQFTITLPAHPVEFRLDATSAPVLLASRAYDLSPTGTLNLGDVLLPPGVTVTGSVRRPNGTAVDGVDLDFRNVVTGLKEYTPNDNSNTLGNFSVVVPSGTYDVEFCPPVATTLAGLRLAARVLTGPTALGNVTLPAGVRLSGTITSGGAPVAGADVNAFLSSTGADVFLCNDNTTAGGTYALNVPVGTYDIVFRMPTCSTLGQDVHPAVAISGNTVLNGSLSTVFASVATYNGDGLAVDSIGANKMILGQSWSAPLTLGHAHGTGGVATLRIRSGVVNGPNFSSPIGGRTTENLINGPLLAVRAGTHDGSTGGFGSLLVPGDLCLTGVPWAAQYTVIGGGFGDFSKAVFGVIAAQ